MQISSYSFAFLKFNCDTVVPTDEEMLNELLTAEIQTDLEFPAMSSGPISDENKEVGILFAEVHSTGKYEHIIIFVN